MPSSVELSLRAALKEALYALCLDKLTAPADAKVAYHVPYAIQGDLWKWMVTKDREEAQEAIDQAVAAIGHEVSHA